MFGYTKGKDLVKMVCVTTSNTGLRDAIIRRLLSSDEIDIRRYVGAINDDDTGILSNV